MRCAQEPGAATRVANHATAPPLSPRHYRQQSCARPGLEGISIGSAHRLSLFFSRIPRDEVRLSPRRPSGGAKASAAFRPQAPLNVNSCPSHQRQG
jgi:hypothetical protein